MSEAESRFISVDGVQLHAELRGRGPDVVLLHGFTGSTRTMADVAAGLVDRFRTISIDLVGHGRSDAPRAAAHYAMARCVEQVAGVLDALDARRAHLLGYSMGGRVALALCAAHPELAASALLVGASAGIAHPDGRAARRRQDAALADRVERYGMPAFVDAWLARPLFESQRRRLSEAARAASREQRLDNRARGLANSLRGMGAGAQEPLHETLGAVRLPVCLAVGDEDQKFQDIAADVASRLPDARIEIIPAAGHAAHLENPSAFLRVARAFFDEVEAGLDRTSPDANSLHPSREVTT